MIIAIDGPSASGKSTTAKGVAVQLDIIHIDTGAMYRALTYGLLQDRVDFNIYKDLTEYIENIEINFNSFNEVCLNDKCLSSKIRSKRISNMVSTISALKIVRKKMVELQRNIAEGKSCVLEGRDIGTVVFPEAEFKFFLNAKIEDRAKRRMLDYKRNGEKISLEEVTEQINNRDTFDSTRKNSPLKMHKDAILIDTSNLSIEQQINKIVNLVKIKLTDKETNNYAK